MRLKRKILLFTIGILSISLLVSSIVTIQSFRRQYADALITGSFGAVHRVESLLNEMLAPGQPLNSLSGAEWKLVEEVEKNNHLAYVYVMDLQGKVLFHSQHARVGEFLSGEEDRRSPQASTHGWRDFEDNSGRHFIELSHSLYNGNHLIGVLGLGFPASVIDVKVMAAIKQLLVNDIITFLLIALLLNIFLHRQVVEPIKRLSKYAKSIAHGVSKETVRFNRRDEIGQLSSALVRMSATLKQQIEALKSGGQLLEEKVQARTRQLAQTNTVLEKSNDNLKQALQRERELSEALRHSEERFRMLFEQNKAVMLIIDPEDGQILAANKVAVAFYG
jgi:methyl-accepting chemotaxis protein